VLPSNVGDVTMIDTGLDHTEAFKDAMQAFTFVPKFFIQPII
jgi:hypothetical protein